MFTILIHFNFLFSIALYLHILLFLSFTVYYPLTILTHFTFHLLLLKLFLTLFFFCMSFCSYCYLFNILIQLTLPFNILLFVFFLPFLYLFCYFDSLTLLFFLLNWIYESFCYSDSPHLVFFLLFCICLLFWFILCSFFCCFLIWFLLLLTFSLSFWYFNWKQCFPKILSLCCSKHLYCYICQWCFFDLHIKGHYPFNLPHFNIVGFWSLFLYLWNYILCPSVQFDFCYIFNHISTIFNDICFLPHFLFSVVQYSAVLIDSFLYYFLQLLAVS